MMRLHHSPASPYVRKVMVILHEAGRTGEVELVPGTGTPLDPSGMPVAVNPLGKLPCLERPDGPALYDSRVICRYLDERFGAGMYPAGGEALWDTLVVEATADGILDAALLMRYETAVRPEGTRSEAWTEAQWGKVARALDVLGARWMGHLAGPFGMGQAAVAAALGYLDFRHPGRDWRAGRAALAAWEAGVAARPSLRATAPPG